MLNSIRTMVSENRKRYIKDAVNLDLSFITDRIIAMAYPSEGLESIFRNSYSQVKKFLDCKFADHYKVYNLRIEKLYDDSRFKHMANYPFHDHQAPPFESLIAFCKDASDWLNKDQQNKVVVHCKAGKGRTGTVICALLLYMHNAKDANEAIAIYGKERTHDMRGVTIPSQLRYIHYFDTMMKHPDIYQVQKQRSIILTDIIIHTIPYSLQQTSPILNISSNIKDKFEQTRTQDTIMLSTLGSVKVEGDLQFAIFCQGTKKALFSFWINTAFVSMDSPVLMLKKDEIDVAFHDEQCKYFEQDFSVEIRFKI
ncbi:phosphatases II [Backusella circina FSU 941]|nr:phosphatases II [Backusella circina FSU 941]